MTIRPTTAARCALALVAVVAVAGLTGCDKSEDRNLGAQLVHWKKETWQTYQRERGLASSPGAVAIPPTDCPPLPAQTCLDTWDETDLPPPPLPD